MTCAPVRITIVGREHAAALPRTVPIRVTVVAYADNAGTNMRHRTMLDRSREMRASCASGRMRHGPTGETTLMATAHVPTLTCKKCPAQSAGFQNHVGVCGRLPYCVLL